MNLSDEITRHCAEVLFKGYTIFRGAVPSSECARLIETFRTFEAINSDIFKENRDWSGHYPRVVNLHMVLPQLLTLFTRNEKHLMVFFFNDTATTEIYTSLF